MAPLISNCHWRDVSWSKYRSENVKSDKYYLRRKKFAIYSLAFLIALPLEPLGGIVVKKYKKLESHHLAEFPNAQFEANNIFITFVAAISAAIAMGLVFEVAYHFDLFWPERVESRCMQLIWRVLAVFFTAAHGAATVVSTYMVTQAGVKIRGVSEDQADAVRSAWDGSPPLQYRHYTLAVICVVLGWVSFLFACCSVIFMVRSQVHNNKLGPFTIDTHSNRYQRDVSETPLTYD